LGSRTRRTRALAVPASTDTSASSPVQGVLHKAASRFDPVTRGMIRHPRHMDSE
jgi:hypothetical protein